MIPNTNRALEDEARPEEAPAANAEDAGPAEPQAAPSTTVPTQGDGMQNDVTIRALEEGSTGQAVDEIISSYDIVMFSKSTCPFCKELKRTLVEYGVSFAVFEADETSNFQGIKAHLKEKSGIGTFPNLFVKGESLGGCMDVKKLEQEGKFFPKIAPFVGKPPPPSESTAKVTSLGLFWFPETVDNNMVRVVGGLSSLYCVICMGTMFFYPTKWAVLALALDYLLRVIFSGSYSVGGAVASVLLARVDPHWTCGPPKQFANICGVMFSTIAAGCFVAEQRIAGAVFLGMLAIAAFGSALNFCVGCIMFGYMIKFKLMSPLVYTPYLNLMEAKKWTYAYTNNTETTFDKAENERLLMPWQTEPTDADFIRKVRWETEYKNADFDIIRHTRIDHFAIPMGGAALAFMFLIADLDRFGTQTAYEVLGVISAIVGFFLAILYCIKFIMHPKKVLKEWAHPVMGNYFSAISICFTIYGILLNKANNSGAMTLIFIGSTMQMIFTVLRVSDLIYDYVGEEMLNPSLMMAPVGNLISAVGFALYENEWGGPNRNGDLNYVYISRLWFGVGALFAIVLFTITFKKALHDHHSDVRLRPTLWIWLATASIAGPAFLQVSGATESVGRGVLFQSLWCIALLFFVINSVGLLKNFYTYPKDMSIWLMPFSLSAFGASTVAYDSVTQDEMFFVLSIIAMTVACVSTAVVFGMTLTWSIDLSLFKPRPKWGPISFMKLTHEVLRHGLPKYVTMVSSLNASDVMAVKKVVASLDGLFTTFDEHSRHEDNVLFPRVRRYFPEINLNADTQHESLHADADAMKQALSDFNSAAGEGNTDEESGPSSSSSDLSAAADVLLTVLKERLPGWTDAVMPHLREEEATFTAVIRKYVPIDEQVKMAEEVFNTTGVLEWKKVFSFMLTNLPSSEWKITYIKTFVWANPARAQEVGLMVYHGVDQITWLMLARAVPQIIPRGVAGHKRIY